MSNQAISMYALGLDQIETAILKGGNKRTILVQGHMGTGKSSLLRALGKVLPNHTLCYFDCTTKDLGDITIPQLQTIDEQGYVRYVTNEELGLHLGKDIVLMVDEYGKAPDLGMITFVDTSKTRKKRDPGRCYLRAGFKNCGMTKGGLIALQLLPEDMPKPVRPLDDNRGQASLFEFAASA